MDSKHSRLLAPEDKKVYIKQTISDLVEANQFTNMQLASVAGMLMAISPAVYVASLYLRKLYQSMGENMDDAVCGPDQGYHELAMGDWQYCLEAQ